MSTPAVEPQSSSAARSDGRAVGEIVSDMWDKAETLIRQELQLGLADAESRIDVLKVDLEQRARHMLAELTTKVLAGAIAFAGLIAVLAAIILALSDAIAPWLAALIVGVVSMLCGAALLLRNRQPLTEIMK